MDSNTTSAISLVIQVVLFLFLGIIILRKNKDYTINVYFSMVFFSIGVGSAINLLAIIFFYVKWLYILFIRLISLTYLIPFFTFIIGFVAIIKGIKYFKENNGIKKSIFALSIVCLPLLIWPAGIVYTPYFHGIYYIVSKSLGSYGIALILLSMIIIFIYLPINLWNVNRIMNVRILLFIFAMTLLTFSAITIILAGMRILDTSLLGIASLITDTGLFIMLFNFLTPFEKRLGFKGDIKNKDKNISRKLN